MLSLEFEKNLEVAFSIYTFQDGIMKKKILLLLMSLFILFSSAAQSAKDYNAFINIVKNELKEIHVQNYEEHFKEQYFIVKEENDYFDVETEVGLSNLYSICLQSDKSQWKSIVKNYFSKVKISRDEEKVIMSKLESFETGKDYLKLRIYPADYKDKISDSSIFEAATDAYICVVVIDLPTAVKSLSKNYIEKWNVSEKAILETAKKNTLENNKEEFEDFEISETLSVSVMLSDTNIFVTTSVFDLNRKLGSLPEYGVFVAIPNRYGIIVTNVNKESVNSDLVELMGLVNYMYTQGPGSITNSIYWFDGKNFYPVLHTPSKRIIKLPDELIKILN